MDCLQLLHFWAGTEFISHFPGATLTTFPASTVYHFARICFYLTRLGHIRIIVLIYTFITKLI